MSKSETKELIKTTIETLSSNKEMIFVKPSNEIFIQLKNEAEKSDKFDKQDLEIIDFICRATQLEYAVVEPRMLDTFKKINEYLL